MANERHIENVLRGVQSWNSWRKEEPEVRPDLSGALLTTANLSGADLSWTDLSWADLGMAILSRANLNKANLSGAHLSGANLGGADLGGADLGGADLSGASLDRTNLSRTNLSGADLSGADLSGANLSGADLSGANLSGAVCVRSTFSHANLSDCSIYGISAWDVKLDGTVQANLNITPPGESAITVDNLEVAQFLYLLIHNEKARAVLDTVTSKVVLILGRFGEHKAVLDALREALRSHPNGYVPVLFDFEPQTDRHVLDTVKTLANLARFIIADLTDARVVRTELALVVPTVPAAPVQPIVRRDAELLLEYSWYRENFKSFLPVYRYVDLEDLLANMTRSVIEPAEGYVQVRRLSDPM